MKASVSGVPYPDAGKETPEEALQLVREFPEFGKVPDASLDDAVPVVVERPDPDSAPKVTFIVPSNGLTIGTVDVEQLDDLKFAAWYLTGFTVCSPPPI